MTKRTANSQAEIPDVVANALWDDEEEGPIFGTLNDLFVEMESERAGAEGFTVGVLIPPGKRVEFAMRWPSSVDEKGAFKIAARRFVDKMSKLQASGKLPEAFDLAFKFAGHKLTEMDLMYCYTVHYWGFGPSKITQIEAIKMSRWPELLHDIVNNIDFRHHHRTVGYAYDGVMDEKKDLSETEESASGTNAPGADSASTQIDSMPKKRRTSRV